MKNITVSVDEETHRLVRIRAAELDTSVSALVREFLQSLAEEDGIAPDSGYGPGETEMERKRRLLSEVFASFDTPGAGSRACGNLTRVEVNDRKRARAEAAVAAWLAEQERESRHG